ncbi:hypothetical protein OIU78_005772 [Salix suchowensis]|nr:hypothetical protein OIU78_005772 [Salix suchowensis]
MASSRVIGATFLILFILDLSFAARSPKAVGKGGGGGGGVEEVEGGRVVVARHRVLDLVMAQGMGLGVVRDMVVVLEEEGVEAAVEAVVWGQVVDMDLAMGLEAAQAMVLALG